MTMECLDIKMSRYFDTFTNLRHGNPKKRYTDMRLTPRRQAANDCLIGIYYKLSTCQSKFLSGSCCVHREAFIPISGAKQAMNRDFDGLISSSTLVHPQPQKISSSRSNTSLFRMHDFSYYRLTYLFKDCPTVFSSQHNSIFH